MGRRAALARCQMCHDGLVAAGDRNCADRVDVSSIVLLFVVK